MSAKRNACQRCGGTNRMVFVQAKCSDMYHEYKIAQEHSYEGYVPDWIGQFGDYVQFELCRHCGQMQGTWPSDASDFEGFYKWGKADVK